MKNKTEEEVKVDEIGVVMINIPLISFKSYQRKYHKEVWKLLENDQGSIELFIEIMRLCTLWSAGVCYCTRWLELWTKLAFLRRSRFHEFLNISELYCNTCLILSNITLMNFITSIWIFSSIRIKRLSFR